MKPGDLVQFTLSGFNYVHSEVKIGLFLNESEEMVNPPNNQRRYAHILGENGVIVKTYNYLKINYETR